MGQTKATKRKAKSELLYVPITTPMFDGTGQDDGKGADPLGNITRTWVLFFQRVIDQVTSAPTTVINNTTTGGGGGSGTFEYAVPTGVLDGINKVFTLPSIPNPPDSLTLTLNGDDQLQGTSPHANYTLASDTITYNVPPDPGDWHFAGWST